MSDIDIYAGLGGGKKRVRRDDGKIFDSIAAASMSAYGYAGSGIKRAITTGRKAKGHHWYWARCRYRRIRHRAARGYGDRQQRCLGHQQREEPHLRIPRFLLLAISVFFQPRPESGAFSHQSAWYCGIILLHKKDRRTKGESDTDVRV